jgi:hypothetical protein
MNQIESEKDLAAIYQSPKTNKLQPEEELVQDVDVSDQRFKFQEKNLYYTSFYSNCGIYYWWPRIFSL